MEHALKSHTFATNRDIHTHSMDEVRGVVYSVGISLAVVWLPVMLLILHYS